jgi:hypothetical protein
MPSLNINVDNGQEPVTVHQMRQTLARVLSRLNGDQLVTFALVANMPNYRPRPLTVAYGELARPAND